MMIDEGDTRTRSLISSAMHFKPGDQRIAKGSTSSISVRQSPIKRLQPLGQRFEAGTCHSAATRRSKICPACSTYGRYYPSALYPTMRQLDRDLALWAKRKYRKLRGHLRRATHWIARISRRAPALFASWQMGVRRGSMMGAV